MHAIEQQMLKAIKDGRTWHSGNTAVEFWNDGDRTVLYTRALVYLHGNHIANVWLTGDHPADARLDTFRTRPTRTTVSRLRALGINASVKNGVAMIDGEPV